MAVLKKILSYLNPNTLFYNKEKVSFDLRMMHGMNRISILLFLVCITMMVIRYVL